MSATDFIHLHVHSDFSLLDGSCRIKDLVAGAEQRGMDAIALTDHGNIFGAVSFYKEATSRGIKPIIGMEGYLAAGSRFDRNKTTGGKQNYHTTLLAENQVGFHNLMKISSAAYLEGFYYRPRFDKDLIKKWGEGIICMSGCLSGELIQTLRAKGKDGARQIIAEYRELFGADNYFIELMDNGLDIQVEANKALIELSEETCTPLVATNDVHYVRADDYESQDVLLCIGTGKLKSDPNRFKMGSRDLYLRDGAEMARLFKDTPSAIANTRLIADRCSIEVDFKSRFLPKFTSPDGLSSEEFFLKLCREGLARLYPQGGPEVEKRFAYEFDVIVKMGFIDYFLIVWDFIRYARDQGIPVGPGRGSAAGSIISYSLGITLIDPLKYDLLFERFLNAERISMPDIDIDFCKDGREQVMRYVAEKYGKDNVTQIITFGTMAAKGVIRDVGRALDIPLGEIDTITKKIPGGPGVTLAKSLAADPELREIREGDSKELFDIAMRIEGCARHCSVHAAGVVITDAPLTDRVPLYKNGDTITTQWTMDVVEEIGLLKMDFLGLRTLTIIDKALKNIKRTRGLTLDPNELPLDDVATYELLQRGDTVGVFQLESDGMRELLRKLRADSFEDIIAILALYRPGPLGSGMDDMYCKRKHGEEEVVYLHHLLEETLKESFGVILYQEQVMRIAASLGGFTLNEADSLRKAMGKKKPEILAKFKTQFVDGAKEKDIAPEISTAIWEQIEYFAGYGFNKSHSAAYAAVTFQTAYLKANYAIEYMAALMTCEMISIDKTVDYVDEAKAMDIEILPPDINHSHYEFQVEGDSIRYALGAIRGAGQNAIECMVKVRDEESAEPFASLFDVCERVDTRLMNKGVLEALVHAGAMDSIEGFRSQKMAILEEALKFGQNAQEDARSGQMSLFDAGELEAENASAGHSALPPIEEFRESEKLKLEKEALGFYLSGHPLNAYRDVVKRFADRQIKDLAYAPAKTEITIGGIIRSVRLLLTKRGKYEGRRMAFVKFEDFSGSIDAVIFASVYGEIAEHIKADNILFLRGEVDHSREEPNLKVNSVIPLEEAKGSLTKRLTLAVQAGEDLDMQIVTLKRLLKESPGSIPVTFEVGTRQHGCVTIQAGREWGVQASPELFRQLESVLGEKSVHYN
ncbi:MAG: DNA polymerase III subunit alpha [Planctomycetota bacterium]